MSDYIIFNRHQKIQDIRHKLKLNKVSLGSWIQIGNTSVAEIMGKSGYDWVALDLEHGVFSQGELAALNMAIELGGTLPLARVAQSHPKDIKIALDAGAGGVILPMIENAQQLSQAIDAACWPPVGRRGVGFSRANLFGANFEEYKHEAQEPLVIAMIENINAVNELDKILQLEKLDAIFIGPYDLSASMGITAQFEHSDFKKALQTISDKCKQYNVASGIHVVKPSKKELEDKINQGYKFIAYSIDAVFLTTSAKIEV